MATIKEQLEALKNDSPKKIRGVLVERDDDRYGISGSHYDLDGAAEKLGESGSSRPKFPYSSVVFMLIQPFTTKVIKKYRISNRTEYNKLLELAKSKKCYIYHASVHERDGKFYTNAKQLWVVDFDSVENIHGSIDKMGKDNSKDKDKGKAHDPSLFPCPYCSKQIKSTPGRTLHVKNKHPDKYEEYLENK